MAFFAYILFVIAVGMFAFNVFCLWENTVFGSDMGATILFHQGNLLAAITGGLAFLVHPSFTWYWCFAPVLGAMLFGMPLLMFLSFLFRRFR